MANAGVTVGSVWLDVLPSMRNFGSELVSQTEGASRTAGQRSGEALGEGAETGFKGKIAAIAAVGTVIGAAVGVAVSAALDIQAGQAKLAAQLGLTAQESERYGRIAGQVYSSAYGESLDQVNEAIKGVHQNISDNLSDADLTGITEGVLNLADAFEVDVGGATAAVGQMLKTGLAPDAQTALDVITAGFQGGVDKAGDFLDTLNEYSTQFRKLGIDGATATGLLSQGLKAGARDADLVADSFKEFSLRAIDGSKGASDAYKALGLDARTMIAQIAKGGPDASAGLQTVLDRLRAMKDPVAQSAAAVGLFGTQAEDMGAALYALDPSTAVAALGGVGDAAARLDDTLGSTAQAQITSFMRTMQMAFVDVVGGYAIPAIQTLADIIGPLLGPALQLVGAILTGVVVPALQGFAQWVQSSQGWLVPLAAGVGVFVLALNAASIATGLWGLATSAAATVMGIARGAVLAFQVGVWLLNAAMAANPVGIIIALLAGLVAGLVVAYNSSETFRNFVDALWSTIKDGAAAAWDALQAFFGWLGSTASTVGGALASGWSAVMGALTTAWSAVQDAFSVGYSAVVGAFQAVGAAATWLWTNVLSPVFSAIGLAARILVAVIVTVLVAPLLIAWNLLSAAAMWLWTNGIQPAFSAIQTFLTGVFTFLMGTIFQPIIDFVVGQLVNAFYFYRDGAIAAWTLVSAGINAVWMFIHDSIFMPIVMFIQATLVPVFQFFQASAVGAWTAVRDGVLAVWTFILNSILIPIVNFVVGQLVTAFYFYRDGAIAAWNLVRDGINAVWSFIRDSIWNPIVQFLTGVLTAAFNTGRDNALGAWNAIRDGIAAVWNFIRDNIWQPLVNFVTGTIPDAFRTAVDAIGRAWDAVKQATRAPIDAVINVVYNNGIVKVWNWVAGLVGLGTLAEYHLPGFARGGAVTGGTAGKDSVLAALMPGEYVLSKPAVDAAGGLGVVDMLHRGLRPGADRKGAANLFKVLGIPGFADGGPVTGGGGGNSLDSLWNAVTGGISSVTSMFNNTEWGRAAIGMVKKLADSLWPALLKKVTDYFASLIGIGGDVPAGSGPVVDEVRRAAAAFGWDTGAQWNALSWIISHESGWRPTAQNPTSTAYGLFQFLDGTWGTVGGSKTSNPYQQAVYGMRYISSRYGSPVGAQGFWQSHGWYDQGGMLPTGWSSVYNGTGKPEPVLTNAQWQQIAQGTTGNDGALHERFDDLVDAVRNSRPITVEDRSGNPVETARAAQLALRLAR